MPVLEPVAVLLDSMHRIRAVSSEILSEKLSEAAGISPSDSITKKDIMSLLVRARYNEELSKAGQVNDKAYRMSNEEMLDQVVS